MEPLTIAKAINTMIQRLEKLKEEFEPLSINKANTTSNYDKTMALRSLRLRSEGVPTTIIDRLARGECWQEKLDMDLAESRYKNHIQIVHIIEAQLNGYQSINRYFSET